MSARRNTAIGLLRRAGVDNIAAATSADNQRAQALLLAAEGDWIAASRLLKQLVVGKVFSPVVQANALSEYSFMLQARARQEDDPSLQAEAAELQVEAAAIFAWVGLPQRQAQALTWLRRVYYQESLQCQKATYQSPAQRSRSPQRPVRSGGH